MKTRINLLNELLGLERPASEITRDLAFFGWDTDDELVVLTSVHMRAILEELVKGTLTAEDASSWADAIEGRDDIALQPEIEEFLKETLFELANPDISGNLTPQRAATILQQIIRLEKMQAK
jgi:hypothetical protein